MSILFFLFFVLINTLLATQFTLTGTICNFLFHFWIELTFKFKGKFVRVVEGEHLLMGGLLISIEEQLGGKHKHGKASFHEVRLPALLLH